MKPIVVLAFSGGLDTSFCVLWLKEQGYDVHTVTANTGGFSGEELTRIERLAGELGVVSHHTVDAREELFSSTLKFLIFGNILRGQVYPLSVSAERVCQARVVARYAKQVNATALAHGSTGAGNDQVRFDVAFRALVPEMKVLAPIRTLGWSRQAETDWLKERGFEFPAKTTTYSINEGMWGTSVGGKETHVSDQSLPEEAFPSGRLDPALPEIHLTIDFDQGVPTAVNGKALGPVELVAELNEIGSKYGIGRGYHLGDTILGIKGRIGFEAAAATLLIGTHRELEKLVLSGKQLFWKETLGNLYGSLLHEGSFFDQLARDLEAFLHSSQRFVSGSARVRIRPSNMLVEGVSSPYSLMNSGVASYGEEGRAWSGEDAEGFCKLFGLSQMLVAKSQGVEP